MTPDQANATTRHEVTLTNFRHRLVLTLPDGQRVVVTLERDAGGAISQVKAKLGFVAPRSVPIFRAELLGKG